MAFKAEDDDETMWLSWNNNTHQNVMVINIFYRPWKGQWCDAV
jgi:hypothetical protein